MKLLLIRESSGVRGDISQGMGIVGTISKKFAQVKILDNNSHYKIYSNKEILKAIRKYHPDIIGFNVHPHNIFLTGKLITRIKEYFPEICLLAGGLHTYSEPYEVADLGVHIVAVEEADLTILPLLKILQPHTKNVAPFFIAEELATGLRQIPGILFFNGESKNWENTGPAPYLENIDSVPFIDYELFNLKDYIKRTDDHHYVTNVIITQRGCPFRCPFCQGRSGGIYGKVRNSSAQYKIDYIRHLVNKYHHDHIIFYDANFTLDRKIISEFCKQMVDSGLNQRISFWCETNVALPIDHRLAQELKTAGCREIGLGVERLTQDGLHNIRKNKNYELIKTNIATLKETGIHVTANALIGFPFDTCKTIGEEEKRFTRLLDSVHSVIVSVLLPLPGTEVYAKTHLKKWYLDETRMLWSPPFYHFAYTYNDGDAWSANYFDLEKKTMDAICRMKENLYTQSIHKLGNPVIDFLFAITRILAQVSLILYRKSPFLERLLFAPIKLVYLNMWKTMVNRFYWQHRQHSQT